MGLSLNFGIDLGTTNSCIAYHNGTSVHVMTLGNGEKTLPSCVMYDHGKVVVGKEAYAKRYHTEQVVYSTKRDIGTDKVYHIDDGDTKFTVTPIEVSAEILKTLKQVAEKEFQSELHEVVITIPAYFNDRQKKDTLAAGKLAGFDYIRLAIEPSSAALAYTQEAGELETVIVYDLGGGTFDVSAVNIVQSKSVDLGLFSSMANSEDSVGGATVSVISIEGNNRLGGDDFDLAMYKELCDYMTKVCRTKYGQKKSFSFNRELESSDKEKLIIICEMLKKNYNSMTLASTIPVNFTLKNGLTVSENYTLNEDTFRKCLTPIFEQTIGCFNRVLSRCLNASKIVLIGGSTKFPLLKQMLSEMYPDLDLCDTISPDYSVAIGAAITAAADKQIIPVQLFDVVPQTIGIRADKLDKGIMREDMFEPVLAKNTVIPARASREFRTTEPDQTTVSLEVYEGDSIRAEENFFLGRLEISDIQPKEKDCTSILVQLSVDINGLLKIQATYDGTTHTAELINVVKSVDRLATDGTKRQRTKLLRYKKLLGEFDLTDEEQTLADEVFASETEFEGHERYEEFMIVISKYQTAAVAQRSQQRTEFISGLEAADPALADASVVEPQEVTVREIRTSATGEVISDTNFFE